VEKIRIWHGQKERYDVVALSCYGGSPEEIRSVVTTIEAAVKAKFPQATFIRADSATRLFLKER